MTSFAFAPSLSFGEGSNGISCLGRDTGFGSLFSSPFSDTDPIMRGMRDGSLSWAEASELEASQPVALFPGTIGPPAPSTPPRQRVTFACPQGAPLARPCPGAPARPLFKKPYSKPCKTIIIRNLPRDSDDLDTLLRTAFSPYGIVRDVYIPKNMDAASPYFGTIKGFALVKFAELASAYSASAVSLRIGGKNLSVEFAKEDR